MKTLLPNNAEIVRGSRDTDGPDPWKGTTSSETHLTFQERLRAAWHRAASRGQFTQPQANGSDTGRQSVC